MNKVTTQPKRYENNPFFVATTGFELLFSLAKSVGIFWAIIAGIGLLGSPFSSMFSGRENMPASDPQPTATGAQQNVPLEVIFGVSLVALIIVAIILLIGVVFRGINDYSASKIAKGETVSLSEAFRAVFDNFWSYTWVLFIASVKTFLWSLLFIIPGFIMAYRYSLSGVAFFDKKLKGNESIKESLRLTKGAWFTTFASQTLVNLLTLGVVQSLLEPGTNAVLYRQFSIIPAGEQKPKAHILSILTVIIPLVLLALGSVLVWVAVAYIMQHTPGVPSSQPYNYI